MINNFKSFSTLPEQLQVEALREGEARMQAQLAVATAADQRALTWGGLLVAAATGAIGGGLALIGKSTPDYVLGLLAVGFSFAMMIAAWHSLQTVQPGQFCLPRQPSSQLAAGKLGMHRNRWPNGSASAPGTSRTLKQPNC